MVDDKKSKERLKKFQTQKNPAKKWKCLRKILGTALESPFSAPPKKRSLQPFSIGTDLHCFPFTEKESPENVKQFWKTNADEIMACTTAYTALLETVKGTPFFCCAVTWYPSSALTYVSSTCYRY